MPSKSLKSRPASADGVLRRLARDTSGNTMMLVAAGLAPLLAMVGGGVDMGRSYLAQSRLQAACDAGVLAARKKLGSAVVTTGIIPADVDTMGAKFFTVNFQEGSYGTRNRSFDMTIEADNAITGTASVDVPVTIMGLFGYDKVPVTVNCQARLNFTNTDVMFVLDTTGSMAAKAVATDSQTKIEALRAVVKDFVGQVNGSKNPGTRVRYGFLPYSTNVNVGGILKSGWVVDEWEYQGREAKEAEGSRTYDTYDTTYADISGSWNYITSYTASTCPRDSGTWRDVRGSYRRDPDGTEHGQVYVNGDFYSCSLGADGSTVTITGTHYNAYTYAWTRIKTGTETKPIYKWLYKPMKFDTSFVKGTSDDDPLNVGASINVRMYGSPSPEPELLTAYFRGCMEERATYEIDDYDAVDFSKALDLDIDTVPDSGDPDTQWRPMLNEISFEREIWWNGTGSFNKNPVATENDYLMAEWAGLSACPTAARKLAEMDDGDVAGYVDSLEARGSTYHDIGMIWGGRMISPTGLFADENADVGGNPTSRHLIFLTDGETAPLNFSYGTYGIEPLDQRRWDPSSSLTLTQVVEKRFTVACNEVKKRNVTVWVVGFGVSLNPIMTQCAGDGHWFEARNAAQLNTVFSKIAASMGDLRISK